MGHFAQIDNNNTVTQVISNIPVDNYDDASGNSYINNTLGLTGNWLHTEPMARLGSLYTITPIYSAGLSGNDYGLIGPLMDDPAANNILSAGVIIQNITTRVNGITGYRLNLAQPGMIYDNSINAFTYTKPSSFPSFVLNTTTGAYEPPVKQPIDGHTRVWDERNVNWSYVMPTSTLHVFWLSAAPDPTTGKIPRGTSVSVNLWSLKNWYTGQEVPGHILSGGKLVGSYY